MSRHPFSPVLEAYLRAKKATGEPLPGIKGRVNYQSVATESGIAHRYFKKGTPLRLLVDAWEEKLGVSNESHTKQPHRARQFESRITTTTYAELKAYGTIWLRKHPYSKASIAGFFSHLNTYMRHFGRTDEDATTDDFGDDFDRRLIAFLKATGKGKTVASVLRLWSRINHEARQSTFLPPSFAEAVTGLIIQSQRPIAEVARSTGVVDSTLFQWMSGNHIPIDPVQIARLEQALNVLPGTLSSKLTFYGVRRSADIPKGWCLTGNDRTGC